MQRKYSKSSKEAFDLINELSWCYEMYANMVCWFDNFTQDKPTDASYLFNLANVTEAGFSYSGSSLKTRHSVVSVSYFNMDSKK